MLSHDIFFFFIYIVYYFKFSVFYDMEFVESLYGLSSNWLIEIWNSAYEWKFKQTSWNMNYLRIYLALGKICKNKESII